MDDVGDKNLGDLRVEAEKLIAERSRDIDAICAKLVGV